MRRSPKNQEQAENEVETDLVAFDDVLHRELDAPTVIELDPAAPQAGPIGSESVLQDSTLDENAALRAELLGVPVAPIAETLPAKSLLAADVAPVGASLPVPKAAPLPAIDLNGQVDEPEVSEPTRGVVGFEQFDFWDRYDEATASADLFAVPPAAITVVVGSLDVAASVAERCQTNHWVSECEVFVLTERRAVPGHPTWKTVRRPSDVVAVIEGGESDFPLIVIDIPRELPSWIRPLIARLRAGGVGLVHYVLGDDPSDEDLATWHGELGRPSVLDLATPVAPGRVLELLDRGEPIASVAGMNITTELLLALRLDR